jgi:hypothetical protein
MASTRRVSDVSDGKICSTLDLNLGFEATFCDPRPDHEKGSVEPEVDIQSIRICITVEMTGTVTANSGRLRLSL